ncbi:MAG: branched-chain amino acid ABC transporter permease [Sulfolobales archaeon]
MPLAYAIIIFGLLALAFNILAGYAGYISFGHGLFFGTGAYVTGLCLRYLNLGWTSLLIALTTSAVLSIAVGAVAVKRSGAYFTLLTVAAGEILHFLVIQFKNITGGDDGLIGIPRPPILNYEVNIYQLYYLYIPIIMLSIIILKKIIQSPFGRILLAIRDNEERVEFLGYNVYHAKLIAMLISGIFSALAGALYVIYSLYVSPLLVYWLFSGEVVFMTILGGYGTFYGPLLGAAIYILLKDFASKYALNWPLIVGALFVIITLYRRYGILEIIKDVIEKMKVSR